MRRYEMVSIDGLKPYENNARTHSEEQVKKIVRSIEEFGFINPVLIDGDFGIIAGHGRVMAAKKMGMTEVPCLFVEDLTEAQKRAYILADNKLALDAGWDEHILQIELAELADMDFDITLTGFELDDIEDDEPQEVVEDDYDVAPPEEPRTKLGDIWQLGRHRLMCGDSTDMETVEQLLDGTVADLVLTDPPYGIEVVQNKQVGGGGNLHFNKQTSNTYVKSSTYMEIKGDDTTDTARDNYEVIRNVSKNQIIFGGNYFTDFLTPSKCWLVWDKENTGNFADVELAWTSFDKGAKLYRWLWNGLCRKGERSVEGKSRVHPTQKPVGLMGEILKDFTSNGETVLDCFGGSGSTLIACEQIDRVCYMMEYEPHYVDVIIDRWEQFTGEKAVLLNG